MRRRTLLLAAPAVLLSRPLAAQSWRPDRPLRLVVPFPPGGGTDIAARVVAERLAEALGQPVVIDNRPGANGAIAGEVVARAAPDGLSLLVATAAGFAAAPALGVTLPYDVARDFAEVGMLGLFPLVLNVHPDVDARSLGEFVRLVRARPGVINYASAGTGGTNHLVMERLAEVAGLSMTHVPYRGAGPAQADLLSGQVQAMIDSLAASLGNIRAGRVRCLGVTTETRQPQIPDVPTLREQGVDLVYPGWASLVAPAGTPDPVLDALSAALVAAMAAPALTRRYLELAIEPVGWSRARTAAFMAEDRAMLTALVRAKGIRAE